MNNYSHFIRIACVLFFFSSSCLCSQHVFIVVIDGARYSEAFGSKGTYIPHMWNALRKQGTIYTNFRNDGLTKTCPGHASLLTGEWQYIANDGSERSTKPTIFEYFRKQTALPESSCYVITGKKKLDALTYSSVQGYGQQYEAMCVASDSESDIETWERLKNTMQRSHPQIVNVNFPEVDIEGHAQHWDGYLNALRRADSLIALLWSTIQSDSIYKNTTTLFVTSDHGRHDEQHGGFRSHGDSCEGCRHIMLLALGPRFAPGKIVQTTAFQIDIAPTAAEILGIVFPKVQGRSLLQRKTDSN